MKKTLLSAIVLLIISTTTLYAQPCAFGNIGIKVNSEVPGPGNTCLVNFDMYFDIDHNAGGKFFWFHVWSANLYSNYNYSTNKAPTVANGGLANTVLSFGFNHFQNNLVPMTSYLPDPSAPAFQATYSISEIEGTSFDRYTAAGLRLVLPQDCNIAQPLLVDAWQTQAENGNNIHCYTTATPVILNDPTITGGLLFCQVPRSYRFDIKTTSISPRDVNYLVMIDNGDGIFNAGMDTIQINGGVATISNSSPYHSAVLGYAPYNSTKPYSDRALWVIIQKNATDIPNDIYARIDNSCAPLPVKLSRFTAIRNKTQVLLNWTTASEDNNKGFFIERKTGTAEWQVLQFIGTKAILGNSSSDLEYQYTDQYPESGLSQYRLRQVDIDEKVTLSDIRIVKGLDQLFAVRVFPNPSQHGEIILVMDKADQAADISLIDMNGRVAGQWNHFTGNRLQINAVAAGIYVLKVWINGENEPQMLRVMVTK